MNVKTTKLLFAGMFVLLTIGSIARAADEVPADHPARMKAGLALFKKHVRPLLVKHCLECHGGKKVEGEFDLGSRELLVESGMLEDDAESSQFYLTITHDEEPYMPHEKDKLPEVAIKHIGEWVNLGAPYDKPLVKNPGTAGKKDIVVTEDDRKFWSFRRLARRELPPVKDEKWTRTPVDRFILAQLEERGIRPNGPANRRTLIRRAYFDLIGLPPTPAEIESFISDPDPQAYEKLLDRLLASPHYGERWARHWMDVARFGESHGYEQDYDRPHAYHYRDFLIKSLNQDMAYDQFVRWQIAGDEFAPDDSLAMTATGFLGAGAFPTQLTENEFESARYDELDDMVQTTASAFLGITVGCARCHEHKSDPIPSSDYYQLASIFTTTIRSEIELDLTGGGDEDKKTKVQVSSEGFPHMKHHADGRGYPHFYKETFLLKRGDVNQKERPVSQGFLQVLMSGGKDASHWKVAAPKDWKRTSFRRAALANWLTDSEHGAGHLAARVIVNRVWQHHFGAGIVSTPNDFGHLGQRPTHPELLDWLASNLIANGWKLKRLHKLMMTSAVYLQNSDADDARKRVDPENLYHWQRTPRRLDGEAIRDAMLHVGGKLDATMYGPGTLDEKMQRRSIYFFVKRSKLIPTMMLFDWPEHLVSIGQRSNTTIAPQALMLMNNPLSRSCAEGFAQRLAGRTGDEAIIGAFETALGRRPSDDEVASANAFIANQAASYRQANNPKADALALADFCQAVLCLNEFAFVD